MELEKPNPTPVLKEWELGVVLEALSRPPYEPLLEVSLKHQTYKTVLLLAVALVGRRCELGLWYFIPSTCSSNLSPEFMLKNQRPSQTNHNGDHDGPYWEV